MRTLLVLATALVLVASAAGGTPGFAPSVLARDGSVRYIATASAGTTTVRAVRVRDGHVLRSRSLRGPLGIPRVAYDGSIEATTSCTPRGTASITSPAPLRSAAWPASEIAPLMPQDPPIKMARPKSPLCALAWRG